MDAISKPVMEILRELINGREIVQCEGSCSLKWKNGKRSPSLANSITAPMMQCALIEQDGITRKITLGGRLNYEHEKRR